MCYLHKKFVFDHKPGLHGSYQFETFKITFSLTAELASLGSQHTIGIALLHADRPISLQTCWATARYTCKFFGDRAELSQKVVPVHL